MAQNSISRNSTGKRWSKALDSSLLLLATVDEEHVLDTHLVLKRRML